MANLQSGRVHVHPDELHIYDDLRKFNLERSDEELRGLEDEILQDGIIRETITIWIPSSKHNWIPKEMEGKPILVDGFSRWTIVKKHNLPIVFEAYVMDFEDIDEAKEWIHLHQENRRNLTPDQRAYFMGIQYNQMKKNHSRLIRFLQLKGRMDLLEGSSEEDSEIHTAQILGKIYNNKDEKTIRRNGHYARGIEIIRERNPTLADQILRNSVEEEGKPIKVVRAMVEKFSQLTPPDRIDTILDVQEVVDSMRKKTDKYHTQHEEIFLAVEKFLKKCTRPLLESAELQMRAYYKAHAKDLTNEGAKMQSSTVS